MGLAALLAVLTVAHAERISFDTEDASIQDEASLANLSSTAGIETGSLLRQTKPAQPRGSEEPSNTPATALAEEKVARLAAGSSVKQKSVDKPAKAVTLQVLPKAASRWVHDKLKPGVASDLELGPGSNSSTSGRSVFASLSRGVKATAREASSPRKGHEQHLSESLRTHLINRDVLSLRDALANLSKQLEADPKAFDVNVAFIAYQPKLLLSERTKDAKVKEDYCAYSALGFVSKDGWKDGAAAIVEWNLGRQDDGQRLDISDSGCSENNLQLAMEANSSSLVLYLLEHGVSSTAILYAGMTPLEVAASWGAGNVASAILEAKDSDLSAGLQRLRVRLTEASKALPYFTQSLEAVKGNSLESVQKIVPESLRPSASEQEIVGDTPESWVLLYQNKVMCASARRHAEHPSLHAELDKVLVENGYNTFMWCYAINIVLLETILGVALISMYLTFRLRVFGWFEVPTSLAELIPGSFDPLRLADADFDPGRLKKQLPYRSVLVYIASRAGPVSERMLLALKAFLGVYSSWFFVFIRIPPEKDIFDEEYMSDDDENARAKVREHSAEKAHRVRAMEVFCRDLALFALFWWLYRCRRLNDAMLLGLLFFMYALLASCTGQSSIPVAVAETERTGEEADEISEDLDAARAVVGLFGVQHGPRWLRAICTVRSTAAPNKQQRFRQRRRSRRASTTEKHGSSGNDDESSKLPSDVSKAKGDDAEDVAIPAGDFVPEQSPFSDRFQRQLLNSGVMHTSHGSYLEISVWTMVSIFVAVVWLLHFRLLAAGTFHQSYQWILPTDLFQVYGGPGAFGRLFAVLGELLLLWFCSEKLYDMACLLNVTTLVLKQRMAALRFLNEHMPLLAAGLNEVSVTQAMDYREQSLKCMQFALELSDARWTVLQKPVSLAVFLTEFMFAVSLALLSLQRVTTPWQKSLALIDPMVFLIIGLVLLSPLVNALTAAFLANAEEKKQRRELSRQSEDVLSSSPLEQESDVEYVKLIVKLQEALLKKTVAWPDDGRELHIRELVTVVFMAIFAIGGASLQGFDFIIP